MIIQIILIYACLFSSAMPQQSQPIPVNISVLASQPRWYLDAVFNSQMEDSSVVYPFEEIYFVPAIEDQDTLFLTFISRYQSTQESPFYIIGLELEPVKNSSGLWLTWEFKPSSDNLMYPYEWQNIYWATAVNNSNVMAVGFGSLRSPFTGLIFTSNSSISVGKQNAVNIFSKYWEGVTNSNVAMYNPTKQRETDEFI